jgi:hypothetical protein
MQNQKKQNKSGLFVLMGLESKLLEIQKRIIYGIVKKSI